MSVVAVILFSLAAVSALPTDVDLSESVPASLDLSKGPSNRFSHISAEEKSRLANVVQPGDLSKAVKFNPDRQIVYHLFTRDNPSVSQPLLVGNEGLLGLTNYDQRRRTIVLIHGWLDDVASVLSTVCVPAFLAVEDLNIIVVDWSAGAGTINYFAAADNAITGGESVARFINWLNGVTGSTGGMYHLVGHSLGAHMAGVAGRNLNTKIAYITGLDPAFPWWITSEHKLKTSDATYVEVIHTNAGLLGYLGDLGHADFYPNGGIKMPGCNSQECDHERCIHYFAESLSTFGFKGTRCATYVGAMTGTCILFGSLRMGGLVPKTGSSGIYYLKTNAAPPFSQG